MKINIELSEKSIQQAIKQLKQAKKLYTNATLSKEFLKDVCMWVINRANWYIENADLGELVKLQLRKGWGYTISNNSAKITNTANKQDAYIDDKGKLRSQTVPLAVLVEFGVGIVGQGNPHPNAKNYEYNVPSTQKDENGMWYFWTNHNELDIPKTSIEDIRGYDDFRGKGNEQGKRIIVGTRGAEGVWYAYNAILDAQIELKKPNGELAQKWKKLLERYIG